MLRTHVGLRVISPLAIMMGVCGALLCRPAAVSASSINCFTGESDRDTGTSPFVSTLCALSDGGGPGGVAGGSSGDSSNGPGRHRGSLVAGANFANSTGGLSNRTPGAPGPSSSEASPSGDPSSGTAAGSPMPESDPTGSQPTAASVDFGSVLAHEAWQRMADEPTTAGLTALLLQTPALIGIDGPMGPVSTLIPLVGSSLAGPGPTTAFAAGPEPSAESINTSDVSALAVPEPNTLALLSIGVVCLLALWRRSGDRSVKAAVPGLRASA
jgi:PEP-CTERM motif